MFRLPESEHTVGEAVSEARRALEGGVQSTYRGTVGDGPFPGVGGDEMIVEIKRFFANLWNHH
jgi:hypothetical protein